MQSSNENSASKRRIAAAVSQRRRAILIGLLLVLASLAAVTSTLGKPTARTRPKRSGMHLRWTIVARKTDRLLQAGPYVFVQTGAGGILLNDRTGHEVDVSPPLTVSCSGSVSMGGSWLMFPCAQSNAPFTIQLYSMPTGRWRALDYAQRERSTCGNSPFCHIQPVAIGTNWLEYSIYTVVNGCRSCEAAVGFQNLITGQWRETEKPPDSSQPPFHYMKLGGITNRSRLDLNASSLIVPVCAPVDLPHRGDLIVTPIGSAISPVRPFGNYQAVGNPYAQQDVAIQRCGSRHNTSIPVPDGGNSRIIVWNPFRSKMDGIFLTTDRRFTAKLPIKVPNGADYVVGTKHVFMVAGSVWEALLPRSAQGAPAE